MSFLRRYILVGPEHVAVCHASMQTIMPLFAQYVSENFCSSFYHGKRVNWILFLIQHNQWPYFSSVGMKTFACDAAFFLSESFIRIVLICVFLNISQKWRISSCFLSRLETKHARTKFVTFFVPRIFCPLGIPMGSLKMQGVEIARKENTRNRGTEHTVDTKCGE